MDNKFRPYDINHPPVIGEIVDWEEGSGMITGWEIVSEKVILTYVNAHAISTDWLFNHYTIEGHPAGYSVEEKENE